MLPSIPTEFTPWYSLAGGVLIGASALLVMLLFGRIAGIAGISTGALGMSRDVGASDWGWRAAFITGLVTAAPVAEFATGVPVAQTVSDNLPGMALAGLLVGFGTVFGSGCTSGHGVCGLARLSARSVAATAIFLVVAIVTVFLLRHGLA